MYFNTVMETRQMQMENNLSCLIFTGYRGAEAKNNTGALFQLFLSQFFIFVQQINQIRNGRLLKPCSFSNPWLEFFSSSYIHTMFRSVSWKQFAGFFLINLFESPFYFRDSKFLTFQLHCTERKDRRQKHFVENNLTRFFNEFKY